jgi:SAM-dependent methyltransferase
VSVTASRNCDSHAEPDLDPYSYQRMSLADGFFAPGKDRSLTAQRILPDDLRGKSVLDLGCGYGYFSLEAARRGAARVLGVDISADNVLNARRFAAAGSLPVEFRQGDVESEPLGESFDYVICLNVLHFLRSPSEMLSRLAAVTRECLLLEVAGLGRSDRRNLGLSPWRAALLERSPVAYVARPGSHGRRRAARWYFTAAALRNFLVHQGHGFARVDAIPSVHKGRDILVAHKRRIGQLVLVAGPAGSGQAEAVARLKDGTAPALAAEIGIRDPSSWTCCGASELDRIPAAVDRLLVHCDLPGLSLDFRDDAGELARCAREVTLVSVSAPLAVLRERFAALRVSLPTRRGWWTQGRRYRRIQRTFEDAGRVAAHYESWAEALRGERPVREIDVSFGDETAPRLG